MLHRRKLTIAVYSLGCVFLAAAVWADDQQHLLIRAKALYGIEGPWGEPGMVLVENGKIVAVGADIELPDGGKVTDVDALMPGIVNAYSMAGLAGGEAEVSREITPRIRYAGCGRLPVAAICRRVRCWYHNLANSAGHRKACFPVWRAS